MKRKKAIVISAIVALLIAAAYAVADATVVKTAPLQFGIMETFDNYEERLEGSDLAVVAVLNGEPENVVYYEDGLPTPSSHHLSDIFIQKVIKGDESLEGSTITIREPYYIVDNGWAPGVTEIYYGDYTALQKGAEYLLFLGWTESWGQYGIASAHEGKFDLSEHDEEEKRAVEQNPRLQKLRSDILANVELELD
ncbi:hypothetical protein M3202_06770 [Alkalihalobacillus oceani]|uniref:Uncharacterized protein n=1 Tax=Halalkalibacter oceani TaxID=1653776 RepID=A0A9X2INV8_9BACI|nr:hypothetical protein [Halalkalibacter oceani]MCM3713782.1 hypothetical protein [Halalkalibacter oceani]